MALPPQVIALIATTIKNNLKPFSETATKSLVQIIIEYGPRARGQAELLRAVAKSAPWAIGIVSSAFAFVVAKIGLSENIQLVVDKGNQRLGLQGSSARGISEEASLPVLPAGAKGTLKTKEKRKSKPARKPATKKRTSTKSTAKTTQVRRKPTARTVAPKRSKVLL